MLTVLFDGPRDGRTAKDVPEPLPPVVHIEAVPGKPEKGYAEYALEARERYGDSYRAVYRFTRMLDPGEHAHEPTEAQKVQAVLVFLRQMHRMLTEIDVDRLERVLMELIPEHVAAIEDPGERVYAEQVAKVGAYVIAMRRQLADTGGQP